VIFNKTEPSALEQRAGKSAPHGPGDDSYFIVVKDSGNAHRFNISQEHRPGGQ
jgi:hypothetical protein